MDDDQTLESYTEQQDQTPICWADQEYGMSSTAQSVDDKSSRSEDLQSLSDSVQCKDKNVPRNCGEGKTYLLWKNMYRTLDNSGIGKFVNGRVYTCDKYTLPGQEGRVPFSVGYIPSEKKLFIQMPVKFMRPEDANEMIVRHRGELKEGSESRASVEKDFRDAYIESIHSAWSSESSNLRLYLKIVASPVNEDDPCYCYNWSIVNPVDVDVSVESVSADSSKTAYKVFYIPWACYDVADKNVLRGESGVCSNKEVYCSDYYRPRTSLNMVAFSKASLERVKNGDGKHNVFAHEFGHQIGLGDEYAIDYKKGEYGSTLKAYDRSTGRVKTYDLEKIYLRGHWRHYPRVRPLRHNNEDYWVKRSGSIYYLVYVSNGKKRRTWLDGTYTRHTQMAVDEFGEEYANQNATMYDETEHNSQELADNSQGLENNLMNKGNVFKPHYYIPFKKAMVMAIQNEHGDKMLNDIPNMEQDWEIK